MTQTKPPRKTLIVSVESININLIPLLWTVQNELQKKGKKESRNPETSFYFQNYASIAIHRLVSWTHTAISMVHPLCSISALLDNRKSKVWPLTDPIRSCSVFLQSEICKPYLSHLVHEDVLKDTKSIFVLWIGSIISRERCWVLPILFAHRLIPQKLILSIVLQYQSQTCWSCVQRSFPLEQLLLNCPSLLPCLSLPPLPSSSLSFSLSDYLIKWKEL